MDGWSKPDPYGNGEDHYDASGRRVGWSKPDAYGNGDDYYDASGRRVGWNKPDPYGDGDDYYDASGRRVGWSKPDAYGNGDDYYDSSGQRVGWSKPDAYGSAEDLYGSRPPYLASTSSTGYPSRGGSGGYYGGSGASSSPPGLVGYMVGPLFVALSLLLAALGTPSSGAINYLLPPLLGAATALGLGLLMRRPVVGSILGWLVGVVAVFLAAGAADPTFWK